VTKFADLHIHTYFSDGTSSPQEVVDEAVKSGLSSVSITDHDTIEAIAPAQTAARAVNLEVIAGIELSSEMEGKDIHVLGYFFRDVGSILLEELSKIQQARISRIKEMIVKLKGEGISDIDFDEVGSLTKSKSVGRPHLATVLLQKGHVGSMAEAFSRYLGEDCSTYVGKFKQTTSEAIQLIKNSGGLAVLAHPAVTNRDELIPSFVVAGLDGIEVYYPKHSQTTVKYYEGLAQKHNLLMTGGSDAHGQAKKDTFIGKTRIPSELVEKMKKKLTENRTPGVR